MPSSPFPFPAHSNHALRRPARRLVLLGGGKGEHVSRDVIDEAESVRTCYRLRPAANVELAEDPLDVRRDRLRADHEPVGDLGLREPFREEAQDLALPRGQAVGGRPILSAQLRGAGQRPPHTGEELLRHERLDDVVVGPDDRSLLARS